MCRMEIMQFLLLVNPKIDTKISFVEIQYLCSWYFFFTHVFFIVTRLNLKK